MGDSEVGTWCDLVSGVSGPVSGDGEGEMWSVEWEVDGVGDSEVWTRSDLVSLVARPV